MSDSETGDRERPQVGEFSLIDEEWVALGYRFPSGYIVMEWVDIPPDADKVDHQSIYHSWSDLRTVYQHALIEWSDGRYQGTDSSQENA